MKKIIILYLLTSQFSQLTFSQQNKIDSLTQLLETSKEDTNKVKTLYFLSDALNEIEPEKAIEFANIGLALAQKTSFTRGISICLNALGNASQSLGEFEKALKYYEERYKIVSEMNDSMGIASIYDNVSIIHIHYGNMDTALDLRKKAMRIYSSLNQEKRIANGYVWIGNIYKEQGGHDTAIENYLNALKIFEKLDDKSNSGITLINISSIYRLLKQYEKAKQFALDAKDILVKSDNKKGVGVSLYRLSLIYTDQNEIDTSTMYLLEAKKIFEKIKDKYFLVLVNNQLGNNFQRKGDHNIALRYFKDALTGAEEMKEKETIANILGNIGIVYKQQKKFTVALEYINKSKTLLEEVNNKNNLKNLSIEFIDIYGHINQPDSVLKYLKLYQQLSDTIYSEQTSKSISKMQTEYETEKKDNQIILLNKDKEIREVKIKEQSKNITLVALAAALLLLSTIIIYLLYRRRRIIHSFEVQQLETKFLRSQLKPHFISNSLNAIRKYIRNHPEIAEEYFDKYSALMRDVLINSEKEFITLEDEFSMLKKYMDLESIRLENGFDYTINIDSNIDSEAVNVPPLILQPIVENAIWHGIADRNEKGRISIGVTLENKTLCCIVENQCEGGQSFRIEPEKKKKSFGLNISKERLRLLSKAKRSQWYLETTLISNGMRVSMGIPL